MSGVPCLGSSGMLLAATGTAPEVPPLSRRCHCWDVARSCVWCCTVDSAAGSAGMGGSPPLLALVQLLA